MRLSSLEAVFFDLDGTLLDTAHDLAKATNHVLTYHGFKPKSFDFIRPLVGHGTGTIVAQCFNVDKQHVYYNLYCQHLLQSYQQMLSAKTQFFPGIIEVLHLLRQYHIPWGIITNKPYWLAQPLLQTIYNEHRFHCLIGRETLLNRKPNPEPLLYACHTTGVAAQNSVYIGDAKSDIMAAKQAKMHNVAAAYGYIQSNEQPLLWEADHTIYSAHELLAWLTPRITL